MEILKVMLVEVKQRSSPRKTFALYFHQPVRFTWKFQTIDDAKDSLYRAGGVIVVKCPLGLQSYLYREHLKSN